MSWLIETYLEEGLLDKFKKKEPKKSKEELIRDAKINPSWDSEKRRKFIYEKIKQAEREIVSSFHNKCLTKTDMDSDSWDSDFLNGKDNVVYLCDFDAHKFSPKIREEEEYKKFTDFEAKVFDKVKEKCSIYGSFNTLADWDDITCMIHVYKELIED